MKLTTKILIGGSALIAFLFWLSFYYLDGPSTVLRNVQVPPDMAVVFPKTGVDLVYMYSDSHANEFREQREKFMQTIQEFKDDDGLRRQHRLYTYRGSDYTRFFLRSLDNAPWVRRLIFVMPDSVSPSKYLKVDSPGIPEVVISRHSDFIPQEFLPTFNLNVVLSHLHKIKNLTEEFVVVSPNIFFANNFQLSDLRTPEGAYVLPLINSTYLIGTRRKEQKSWIKSRKENSKIWNF